MIGKCIIDDRDCDGDSYTCTYSEWKRSSPCSKCEYFSNDIVEESLEEEDEGTCYCVGCSGDPVLCAECEVGLESADKQTERIK